MDEGRQCGGSCDDGTEGSTCERHVVTLVHNVALGIECGFQLVDWGVCVNCSAEPRAKANAVIINEAASRTYGGLLCHQSLPNNMNSLSPRLPSAHADGTHVNRDTSRRTSKIAQRRTSDIRRAHGAHGVVAVLGCAEGQYHEVVVRAGVTSKAPLAHDVRCGWWQAGQKVWRTNTTETRDLPPTQHSLPISAYLIVTTPQSTYDCLLPTSASPSSASAVEEQTR